MTGATMAPIRVTECDGVPVLWADIPGPLTAELIFRVGKVDETLPLSGVTHLVEHLALHELGKARPRHDYNGSVTWLHTNFVATGTVEEVVGFVNQVAGSLTQLPTANLAHEREVLRAEASRSSSGHFDSLLVWRYGVTGPGLSAFGELGLEHLDEARVRSWSADWFTRDNAILWLSGPPPTGLRLSLPTGLRRKPTPFIEMMTTLPGKLVQDLRPAFITHVTRSAAAGLATRVVQDLLVQGLRHDRAASYRPEAGYEQVGRDVAQIYASADVAPGREQAVADGLLSVLGRVGDGDFDLELLKADLGRSREWLTEPAYQRGWLKDQAEALLNERPVRSFDDWLGDMLAVTVDQVTTVGHEAAARALYRVPPGVNAESVPTIPAWSEHTHQGRTFRPAKVRDRKNRLSVGGRGVTRHFGTDRNVSVDFATIAAMLSFPTGRRELIADDGGSIRVHPDEWRNGRQIVAMVDASVDQSRVVTIGDHDAARRTEQAGKDESLDWRYWLAFALVISVVVRIVEHFFS